MIYMVIVLIIIVSFVQKVYWIMYVMSPQIGFIIGLFNVCISISISDIVPSNKIGFVSGIRLFLLDLGFGVGPLLCANSYESNPNNAWYIQIISFSLAGVVAFITAARKRCSEHLIFKNVTLVR
eukprot:159439_1